MINAIYAWKIGICPARSDNNMAIYSKTPQGSQKRKSTNVSFGLVVTGARRPLNQTSYLILPIRLKKWVLLSCEVITFRAMYFATLIPMVCPSLFSMCFIPAWTHGGGGAGKGCSTELVSMETGCHRGGWKHAIGPRGSTPAASHTKKAPPQPAVTVMLFNYRTGVQWGFWWRCGRRPIICIHHIPTHISWWEKGSAIYPRE